MRFLQRLNPFANITKEFRKIMATLERIEGLVSDLGAGITTLTATIADESKQQRAVIKELTDEIASLNAGNVDTARLDAIADKLSVSVATVQAAAEAAKEIVPDAAQAAPPNEQPTGGASSVGSGSETP